MTPPRIPDIPGLTVLTPAEMNNIHFSGQHSSTSATPADGNKVPPAENDALYKPCNVADKHPAEDEEINI